MQSTTRGRPRTNPLPRKEQLRRATRARRLRQRSAGLVHVQLTLPKDLAGKLAVARSSAEFMTALDAMVDRLIVRVSDYPMLSAIAPEGCDGFLSTPDALKLYETNTSRIDVEKLELAERMLLERLTIQFGGGANDG